MTDKIVLGLEAEITSAGGNDKASGKERLRSWPDLYCLLALLSLEMVVFLPLVGQVGFYLDDWTTFANLHFASSNFIDVLKASLNDPRMITRPVQCLYYAVTYLFCGDVPRGYHIIRCLSEAAGAYLLYLCLSRLTKSRMLAFAAAALFIVYPSHDCSHYWIGAGLGSGTGLTLYLLSLYFYICSSARQDKRNQGSLSQNNSNQQTCKQDNPNQSGPNQGGVSGSGLLWYYLSLVSFTASAYCYEAFLPLIAVHFLADIIIAKEKSTKWAFACGAALKKILPFLFIGASVPVYQRWLVPKFTEVFLSPAKATVENFLTVPLKGLDVSLGPAAWQFTAARIKEFISSEVTIKSWWQLAAVFVITTSGMWLTRKEIPSYKSLGWLCILSIPIMLISYLTFAVADGYMPTLTTMINRVNTGAALGACSILASAACLIGLALRKFGQMDEVVTWASMACLVTALTAADLGCAGYWLRSWTVQKHVQQLVNHHLETAPPRQCLLLANCPRYTMWSPVFDGVWDFQSMCRIESDNKHMKAGVISERLQFAKNDVKDYSLGHLCATYPYKDICLLFPSGKILPISTAADFIEAIKAQGMDFGLDRHTVDKWQTAVRGLSLVNGDDPQSRRE